MHMNALQIDEHFKDSLTRKLYIKKFFESLDNDKKDFILCVSGHAFSNK